MRKRGHVYPHKLNITLLWVLEMILFINIDTFANYLVFIKSREIYSCYIDYISLEEWRCNKTVDWWSPHCLSNFHLHFIVRGQDSEVSVGRSYRWAVLVIFHNYPFSPLKEYVKYLSTLITIKFAAQRERVDAPSVGNVSVRWRGVPLAWDMNPEEYPTSTRTGAFEEYFEFFALFPNSGIILFIWLRCRVGIPSVMLTRMRFNTK